VESAVGAHLANAATAGACEVFYWREGNHEVDFVLRAGKRIAAIEVKSTRRRDFLPGMSAFSESFRPRRSLLVGADGIAVEEFSLPARGSLAAGLTDYLSAPHGDRRARSAVVHYSSPRRMQCRPCLGAMSSHQGIPGLVLSGLRRES
jgi:hypothetical protein